MEIKEDGSSVAGFDISVGAGSSMDGQSSIACALFRVKMVSLLEIYLRCNNNIFIIIFLIHDKCFYPMLELY
jgi:hypothetical protein